MPGFHRPNPQFPWYHFHHLLSGLLPINPFGNIDAPPPLYYSSSPLSLSSSPLATFLILLPLLYLSHNYIVPIVFQPVRCDLPRSFCVVTSDNFVAVDEIEWGSLVPKKKKVKERVPAFHE